MARVNQALVSTKSSAGTTFPAGPPPALHLRVGQEPIVLPRDIVARRRPLGLRKADDAEGRMGRGIEGLTLERRETAAEHVRLGGVEVLGEPVQTRHLLGGEVHLDGLGHAGPAPLFMILSHDIMIAYAPRAGKLPPLPQPNHVRRLPLPGRNPN